MKREKRALGENFKKSPRSKTVTDIIENFTLIFLEKSPWSQKTKLDLDKNVSRDRQKELHMIFKRAPEILKNEI